MTESHLTVTITGPDRDEPEDLEAASRQLRDELLEIEGIEIATVPDQPQRDATRSTGEALVAFAIASIYIGRPLIRDFAPQVGKRIDAHIERVIVGWLERHRDKKIRITQPDGREVEYTGYSAPEAERLINGSDRPDDSG